MTTNLHLAISVLMKHAERDIDTLIGPHRDEMIRNLGQVGWERALLRSIDRAEAALRLHALREAQQHLLL